MRRGAGTRRCSTIRRGLPARWSTQPKEGGNLSDDQFDRLKAELEDGLFRARRRAGRPLLLEGGLDWKAMGLTPKDMDFIEAKNAAGRDIALAFGVPPMLLGIPGDNTYANYRRGQPRVLPADRAAADRAHGRRRCRLAVAGVRRRAAGCGSTSTRSRHCRRSARRCGRGSDAPVSSATDEKREAVGYRRAARRPARATEPP